MNGSQLMGLDSVSAEIYDIHGYFYGLTVGSCDTPKSEGSLTSHQHLEIPVDIVCFDTTHFNLIYRDLFIYIQ